MNTAPFVAILIVLIIIILFICSTDSINKKDLDSTIFADWWRGSQEFVDQAGLKYMFIQFESAGDNKYSGYITAGDDEGMIFNGPISIKLSKINSDKKYKGKYNLHILAGELPFPEDSILVIDRANCSFSVYKDDTLYGHFTPQR